MNLQDLGNLGEFISSIAVLISLIYLALQIRDNTEMARLNVHQQNRENSGEFYKLLSNPEISQRFRAGLDTPGELPADEHESFQALLFMLMNQIDVRVYQRNLRVLRKVPYDDAPEEMLRNIIGRPGFELWWVDTARAFSPEFREMVETLASEEPRDSGNEMKRML